MAIELKVEEYCQNCPEFEPRVDVNSQTLEAHFFVGDPYYSESVVHNDTTVYCAHHDRCSSMYNFIRKESADDGR